MKRILVVDDEPLIRKAVSRLLTRRGYSVVSCADGEEALREAERLPFDVALVDYEMPGRDGLKVLSGLRERQPAPLPNKTSSANRVPVTDWETSFTWIWGRTQHIRVRWISSERPLEGTCWI